MHGLVQVANNFGDNRVDRLTTKQAIVALRLVRLKMHTQYNFHYTEIIRMIFWKKEHGEFFKVSVQSMINRTLSWDRTPGREDVLLAINLLLEFAKKDPKMFKYWNC